MSVEITDAPREMHSVIINEYDYDSIGTGCKTIKEIIGSAEK